MQGHLYVENKDAPKLKFQSRFFVLFPFCGLRWFAEEPEDLSESSLLTSGEDGGWIFGGNIRLSSVVIEEPDSDQIYAEIFPFSILVTSPIQTYQIRFATDDEDIRIVWTDQIKKAIYIQNYLHACIECNAIPSKVIFCSALAGHDVVNIENEELTVPTLGSLVMVCKFNFNLGTCLRAIHLENTSLTDNHCPLLASLLSFTPLLESLSFANNYITDKGFILLIDSLQNCTKHLNLIDFSSNFLSDVGLEKLCVIFRNMKKLHHLDLSRNKLSTKAAKYLALHLTGYDDSRLTYLNLSYNSVGNTIAQLIALLLTTEKAMIVNIDVSFCHMSTKGFQDLCVAIPKCRTLQVLNIGGNFADDATLGLVMDSLAAHQRKYGIAAARDGGREGIGIGGGGGGAGGGEMVIRREALHHASSQLDIHLGGMLLTDAKVPKCLSFTTLRAVLSHVSEVSSTRQAHLRKRMDVLFSQQNAKEHTAMNHQKRHIDMKTPKTNVIVCIRVQLMPYMETISEVMDALADELKCNPQQLVILSASDIDDSDSTFIIFTALDASGELQTTHIQKTINKRCLDNNSYGSASAKSSLISEGNISLLPSSEKIAIMLQKLSHKSSPQLRTIGIRTVYIQRRDKVSNQPVGTSYHCHIRGGGSGGNGITDSCIPPLFPYAEALQDMRLPTVDPYLDVAPSMLDIDSLTQDPDVTRARAGRRFSLEELNEPGYFFQEDEDEDEKDPLALAHLGMDNNNNSDGDDDDVSATRSLLYTTEDLDNTNLTNTVATVQVDDAKFLSLINRLKLDYEISTEAGDFWAAVFSDPADPRCREIIDNGLKTAYNVDGIFHNVGKRQQVGTTMFERDKEGLTMSINILKSEKVVGGETIILAERLLNEITMLRHDAGNLDALAQGPDDISIVEEFLVNCGRIGYTGPEILVAVELREYLVQWAMELDPTFETVHLNNLKQRALITNLMISRNFEMLQSKLSVLRHTISDNMYDEATTLLQNFKTVRNNLTRVMAAGNDRGKIEDVLAEAAYYNIYDDIVVEAIEYVISMSSDISTCFADLVNVLQNGDRDDLDKIFNVMDDIGWKHAVVDRETILKMFDRRNQLIDETNAMNNLIRISNILQQNMAIASSSSSSSPNKAKQKSKEELSLPPLVVIKTLEIMSCIRTIKTMGLAQLQEAKIHMSILENQVKKAAKMASQEDEILQLIDNKQYDQLSEMLSGVGSGTLVMSASSEDDMTAWMQMLELVCKLGSTKQLLENTPEQNDKLASLYKHGVLEKAARGKEKTHRNWRQRYFVLDGLTISYYTKEGGERKGCVRVGGGRMRLLDPSEEQSSGKRFCFELREGRDLSAIDPDLIKEAHRQIRQVETEKYNEDLIKAIAQSSGDACSSLLKDATEKGYDLDFELVSQAKMLLLRLQQVEVKKELRTVCKFIPRGQIVEVVKKSVTFRLDQELWMCKLARILTERAEAELAILRSRGWLKMQDDNAFKRSLASVQRFDLKRLGNREKKLLAAVLLQNAGATMERLVLREGALPTDAVDNITQTLEGVMQYFVETEPMQLARLVIAATNKLTSFTKKITNATGKSKSVKNGIFQKQSSSSVVIMPDTSASSFLRNKTEFTLDKFMNLRSNSHSSGFLGRKSVTGGARKSTTVAGGSGAVEAAESITFSTDALAHPLSRLNKSIEKDALEHFKALQVVMSDRSLQSCMSSRCALFAGMDATTNADINGFSVLASRLVSTGINTPLLRDELYIQLLKQINGNPTIKSLIQAWTLLSVYLHCFAPSMDFLPYLKNSLLQASVQPFTALTAGGGASNSGSAGNAPAAAPKRTTLKSRLTITARFSQLHSPSSTTTATPHADLNTTSSEEDKITLKNLIAYTNKVVQWTEGEMQLGVKGFQSDISLVDEHLMLEVMKRTQLKMKIGAMTGSVYEISFCFGELANVFSILVLLFEQIVGRSYVKVESLKTMPNLEIEDTTGTDAGTGTGTAAGVGAIKSPLSPSTGTRGPTSRVSVLERSSSTFFGDRSSASGFKHPDIIAKCFRGFCLYDDREEVATLDARTLPVQPAHSSSIAWNHDVVWDTLQNYMNSSRLLYLRRKFLLVSELLIDSQLDLFGDEVTHMDSAGLKKLWVNWLCDPLPDLPVDHMRIDLLFAEESRYVNSQLYGVSDDGCAYLLAIQMLLTWNVEEEKMALGKNVVTDLKWGSGHIHIMQNIDSSVRPSAMSVQPSQVTDAQQLRMMGGRGSQSESKRKSQSSTEEKSDSFNVFHRLSLTRKAALNVVVEADEDEEESEEEDEDDDEASTTSRNDLHWHGKVIDINALEDSEINSLKEKLSYLGTSDDNNTPDFIESVAYFMSKFQNFAKTMDISTQNQRFRYMMKTAYLSYVMSWPLAGGSFAMTSCDITGEMKKTLACVSANGLYLLTVDDWSLLFHSPLYDIESYNVTSAQHEPNASSEDKVLTIVINELHIKLISTSTDDLINILDGLCLELLAKGVYRHGLEGGFDILDKEDTFVSSTDPTAVFKRFQVLYSFLPVPPTPTLLMKASAYVEPPKSRRAILAEARAEEERIELEQARLAAQAAADRNQAHIEKGRQALTTMMEDDDDEDDEEDEGGAQKKPGRVKKQRRRISLLGKGRQHVNPLQMRMQMVENAVCGVSSRPSALPDVIVPPIPERRTGMRTDSMLESGLDLSEKPPLISEKTSLNTTSPFGDNNNDDHKLKREPMLLPKEAKVLNNMQFPLIPLWGQDDAKESRLEQLQSGGGCQWLFSQEDEEEEEEDEEHDEHKDDDASTIVDSDIDTMPSEHHSIRTSEHGHDDGAGASSSGIEESKANNDDANNEFSAPQPGKTEIGEVLNDDESFYSHEIGQMKQPVNKDVVVEDDHGSFYSDEL